MNKETIDYPFIRYPRALIENPYFYNISIEARTLLAMILDRFGLSSINHERFTDENGEIYVIYTIEEICEKFGCSNTRTLRIFNELENKGIITRNRKNRLTPYRIYITDVFYEHIKYEFTTSQNRTSRINKMKSHDFTKCEDSNINNSNNNLSNNQSSIIGFERTEEEIREQIEYDCLVCDKYKKLLDEIVMIMSDVFNSTNATVRIGKDEMPRGVVISRFCKLNSEHILYIISGIESNKTEIKNMKSYLVTMLYNIPATMESIIAAEFAYHHKSVE